MNPSPPRSLGDVVAGLIAEVPPLSCDESFARVDSYVEHLVADPQYEDAAVRRHLETCRECADDASVVLELTAADLTPGASSRILP